MVRKQKRPRDPNTPKRVIIDPDLHKILLHKVADEGGTVQDLVNSLLTEQLQRKGLLSRETLSASR